MNEQERTQMAWKRIENWLLDHFPSALDNLRAPAAETQILELESQIGMKLPDALRVLYTWHDGEEDNWPPHAFDNAQWFLPCDEVTSLWKQQTEFALELQGTDDTYDHWCAQAEDNIIFIKGPVKPLIGSNQWIPFSTANGDVYRYLDFDPPEGGVKGQVIEIDPESCMYQVLAPSFIDFLEQYATDLEQGYYSVVEDCIVTLEDNQTDPSEWGVPDFLKQTNYQEYYPDLKADNPVVEHLSLDDEVTLVGSMGTLIGGPEIIFALETEQGKTYTFLASAKLTKGYGSIAVRQHAQVKAKRYTPEIESYFVHQALHPQPDFVAIEYHFLRERN